MFSQKSPKKKHLSQTWLPGHNVRRPSLILVGNVNDSCIIHTWIKDESNFKLSDLFGAWCQLLDQLTISNLLFSNISLSICQWRYNYLLLGFRILVGHISHQNLRKFSLITRIILQKHKYDIQIFPNYSWMTVLFENILKVKDIMKYFLSKWSSLKRSFERYFHLLRTLTFVIPYWTYWSLVILSTGHIFP